jgi:hypothetical protein
MTTGVCTGASTRERNAGPTPEAAAVASVTVVVMTRNRRDNVLATLERLSALPEAPR